MPGATSNTNLIQNTNDLKNYWVIGMNFLQTALPFAALTGLSLCLGSIYAGTMGVIGAFCLASAIEFPFYYFSSDIVLWLFKARDIDSLFKQADEETLAKKRALEDIIDDLAEKSGVSKPKLMVIEGNFINAFVVGRNPNNSVIVVTKGLLDAVDFDNKIANQLHTSNSRFTQLELKGLMAFQMARIINYDMLVNTLAAVMNATIGVVCDFMERYALYGRPRNNKDDISAISRVALYLISLFAPVIAKISQLAVARAREACADRTAVKIMGEGNSLASALRKIMSQPKVVLRGCQTLVGVASTLFVTDPTDFNNKCPITNDPLDTQDIYNPNNSWFFWIVGLFSTNQFAYDRIENIKQAHNIIISSSSGGSRP